MKTYGSELKRLIKAAGYKQLEVAQEFGLSESLVSAVIKGVRGPFDEDTTKRMVRWLCLDTSEIQNMLTLQANERAFLEFYKPLDHRIDWDILVKLRNKITLGRMTVDQWKSIECVVDTDIYEGSEIC